MKSLQRLEAAHITHPPVEQQGTEKMARKAFTEHPMFLPNAAFAANHALREAVIEFGLEEIDILDFEAQAGRVVDDITKLLLRAYDAKKAKYKAA